MYASRTFPPLTSALPVARATGSTRLRPIMASVQAVPYVGKPRTLYEVLQVKETASVVEIRTAYRSLAKRLHPDASSGDSSNSSARDFIEIHRAYSTLSDPEERARYDLSIVVGAWPTFASAPGSRNGFAARFQSRRWETDQCW